MKHSSPFSWPSGCSLARQTTVNPDCTQVSAEEQAKGNCMYRPEVPEEKSTRSKYLGWVHWDGVGPSFNPDTRGPPSSIVGEGLGYNDGAASDN